MDEKFKGLAGLVEANSMGDGSKEQKEILKFLEKNVI